MQYTRLGDTGLVVSRLAFGVMTFGKGEGIFANISRVDEELSGRLVAKALDAGINFFNTADVYTGGKSEEMLGRALGSKRHDAIIATKVAFRQGPGLVNQGLSRHHILLAAEASLRRLGTDYIDVYLAHRMDRHTPIEETVDAMETLVKQGKVRYVGFSNWPAWVAAKAVGLQRGKGASTFRAAELYYSLLGREVEHELAPFCEDAGIGIMAWSPLAGGLLSGKYTKENPRGDGGRIADGFSFVPHVPEKTYAVVDVLTSIAAAHGGTPAQVSLAWLLTRPALASVLIGANKEAQLDDNIRAADLKLTDEDLKKLDEATAPAPIYPNWFNARAFDVPVRDALA